MGNSLEQALKRCDFGGACAPPFRAVKRLSTPLNASWASCTIKKHIPKGLKAGPRDMELLRCLNGLGWLVAAQ